MWNLKSLKYDNNDRRDSTNTVIEGHMIDNDGKDEEQHLPTDEKSAKHTEAEGQRRYPYSVFFIIGTEFCERFSFYGMKAILPIYLTSWLGFKENRATTIIHSFNFSAYFFALFGGLLSDNFLGKFKTILYLSIVYCIGNGVMSVTALPGVTGTPPNWWGMAVGLLLIGVGTGGIKPCVASFGGDQFGESQIHELGVFFSIFYFAINAGSVLSMFLTPLLRKDVHCFGQNSCYPLAFGVPAVLMFVATLVFIAGIRMYKKEPARSNVVLMFFALIGTAIWRRTRSLFGRRSAQISQAQLNQAHWLHCASDKYDAAFIEDARRVLAVFSVFVPICVFWALYDQQGSWWVYQAVMMNNEISIFGWSFSILPEQMGLANAVLILVLIPLFSNVLYPVFGKIGLPMRALMRIFLGMVLGMVSFILAAILQFTMSSRGTFVSSPEDPTNLVCVSGCVNILWQLPQYFVITTAEVFLSVTGLEFAYSQAPASMKSVCQAGWLLTVAGGNLIVIIVTLIDPISWFGRVKSPMAWDFVLWTGILGVGTIAFAMLAWGYKYREDGLERIVMPPPIHQTNSQLSFSSDAPLLCKNTG
jgi:solute carrier family 15 oligopeptide transporter 1